MNTNEKTIRTALSDEQHYADYLLADSGDRLAVYPDGSVSIGQDVGNEISENERPLAWVTCPGVGNADFSHILNGEKWEDFENNEEFETAVKTACEEGDITDELSELIEKL